MGIRLFVAVDLPQTSKERLGGLMGGITGARWVAVENLHLTLCFLGYVPHTLAQDIQEELYRISVQQFSLTLDTLGRFKHSLWVSMRSTQHPLFHLYDRVRAILSQHLVLERRRFRPHVTLARFKKGVVLLDVSRFLLVHSPFKEDFLVQDFTLFESILTKEGAVYRPIRVYPLYA